MSDRPIGIEDLFDTSIWKIADDHWYWCRRHEKAEPVNEPTVRELMQATGAPYSDGDCVRVGPFMTEWEANRLSESQCQVCGPDPALGMAVEE